MKRDTMEQLLFWKSDKYIEFEHRIFSTYESLLNGTNIQVSDAQGQKITKKLHEYLIQIWKAKGEVDDGYVSNLISDILLNGWDVHQFN